MERIFFFKQQKCYSSIPTELSNKSYSSTPTVFCSSNRSATLAYLPKCSFL